MTTAADGGSKAIITTVRSGMNERFDLDASGVPYGDLANKPSVLGHIDSVQNLEVHTTLNSE